MTVSRNAHNAVELTELRKTQLNVIRITLYRKLLPQFKCNFG